MKSWKIDTDWKKAHAAQIEYLNTYLSDENEEAEICRQLRIVHFVDNAVNEAIEEFDFDRVLSYMNITDWKWVMKDGTNRVPSKEDMIKVIQNFKRTAIISILQYDRREIRLSTGGIVFELICNDTEYTSECDVDCMIMFDIS